MSEPLPGSKREQVLVRVAPETYAHLQLAIPFVGKRSMQDLVAGVLDDFLANLRQRDAGFAKALIGLQESWSEQSGVLARRRATRPK